MLTLRNGLPLKASVPDPAEVAALRRLPGVPPEPQYLTPAACYEVARHLKASYILINQDATATMHSVPDTEDVALLVSFRTPRQAGHRLPGLGDRHQPLF